MVGGDEVEAKDGEVGGGLGVGAIEEDFSMGSTFTSTFISWECLVAEKIRVLFFLSYIHSRFIVTQNIYFFQLVKI